MYFHPTNTYTLTIVFLVLLKSPGHSCGNSCSCVCGSGASLASHQGRIWDGTEVTEGGRPFQVLLIHWQDAKCGGVIYNSLNILTAAHCLQTMLPVSGLRAYVGLLTTPTSNYDPSAVSEAVSSTLPHPKWQKSVTAGFDVGIVRLSAPIKYGPNVQPLPLIEPGLDLAGKAATVSGWGQINQIDRNSWTPPVASPILLQATGTILSKQECLDVLSGNIATAGLIPSRFGEKLMHSVCVYGPGGRGACRGDSGGPLTCQADPGMEGNPTRLCGLVSRGFGCGKDAPVIHTEVNNPELFKWILDNAGPPDSPTFQY